MNTGFFFFISLSEGKWCPLFPHPYTCRAWSFCEEGTPIGVTIATLINRTSVDVTWCYQILIKVLNIASSEGEGHNGGGWGVLTANILWKIPQRQHTGVDIGRGIEAEHVLMRAGKCHSCSFTLISHTHVCFSLWSSGGGFIIPFAFSNVLFGDSVTWIAQLIINLIC